MLKIETQSRMALVLLEKAITVTYRTTEKKEWWEIRSNANISLGTYSTKERAMEVFSEIKKSLIENDAIIYEYFTGQDGMQHIHYTWNKETIYQMPKE